MKKQDTVKLVIAVVLLLGAAIGIAWNLGVFGGSGGGGATAGGGGGIGGAAASQPVTQEELEQLAEDEGAVAGGSGPVKPQRRVRP